jgi:hypothetical protein
VAAILNKFDCKHPAQADALYFITLPVEGKCLDILNGMMTKETLAMRVSDPSQTLVVAAAAADSDAASASGTSTAATATQQAKTKEKEIISLTYLVELNIRNEMIASSATKGYCHIKHAIHISQAKIFAYDGDPVRTLIHTRTHACVWRCVWCAAFALLILGVM